MNEYYVVTFTDSGKGAQQQSTGRAETVALLHRLSRLGATAVLVQASNGEQWSGDEAIRRLDV